MEAESPVELIYWRAGKSETFSGTVITSDSQSQFSGLSFKEVLRSVGAVLRCYPTRRLLISRKEAPYPVTLPPHIEELIRTDPEAAAEALTVPPQKVFIDAPRMRASETSVARTIKTGHDTLADAFGDVVYVRAKSHLSHWAIESPLSGRWVPLIEDQSSYYGDGLPLNVEPLESTLRWVTVRVQDLLARGKSQYYLPREWNGDTPLSLRGWVSHQYLSSLYDQYKKEKDSVSIHEE